MDPQTPQNPDVPETPADPRGFSPDVRPTPPAYPRPPAAYPSPPADQTAPPYQPAPAYQPAPTYQPGAVAPVSESDAKMWSMGAHLGGAFLSFLVPLVIYLVYKDRSPFIRQHSAEALNFQITAFIGYAVSVILMVVLIGFFTFIAIAVCVIIFAILATMAANDGKPYRYPVNIRFIS